MEVGRERLKACPFAFMTLYETAGETIATIQKEMFNEGRAAFQSYRTAFTHADPARMDSYIAEGRRHDKKAKQHLNRMVAEIRKQLSRSAL